MTKYVTYYDCSGWRSLVEVMNADTKLGRFSIKAFHRNGSGPVFQETRVLKGHESTRVDVYGWLDQHGYLTPAGTTEGLVIVEPFPDPHAEAPMSLEFPAVLIICPKDEDDYYKYNRFVPFTRIP